MYIPSAGDPNSNFNAYDKATSKAGAKMHEFICECEDILLFAKSDLDRLISEYEKYVDYDELVESEKEKIDEIFEIKGAQMSVTQTLKIIEEQTEFLKKQNEKLRRERDELALISANEALENIENLNALELLRQEVKTLKKRLNTAQSFLSKLSVGTFVPKGRTIIWRV